MPTLDVFQESDRQFTICNACRYCEGFCPVFRAMELRREFKPNDILYFSNLCHDCRACYYACMFIPPHEFAINIPQMMSEARIISYQRWSWPNLLSKAFSDRKVGITLACFAEALIIALAVVLVGPNLFVAHTGPGSFYQLIPYLAMVLPAIGLSVYWLVIWARGGFRFWREAGDSQLRATGLKPIVRAMGSAFSLRYLGGGGPGCTYPDEPPSEIRRVFHSFIFWGFLADLLSTTLAFIFQDFLHKLPPYSAASAPVIFGTLGGIAIIIGATGLIALKIKSDRAPAGKSAYGMDYQFLVVLGVTALTGMLTLLFRTTPALGILLSIHLGAVAALFLTAPYGKFVHAVYRSLALIQYYAEQEYAVKH